MAGRLGGNAPKSIGTDYTLAKRQVPGAMNSNFSTGQGMATSRKHPTDKNPANAAQTSAGS